MKTYSVTTYRDEGYWMVEVPELDLLTQARRLGDVERMARSIISLHLDVARDSFDLDIRPQVGDAVQRHLERAARLREESARANAQAAEESRAAARELHEQGIPLRDVGKLLGVSYQRAHQLVSS